MFLSHCHLPGTPVILKNRSGWAGQVRTQFALVAIDRSDYFLLRSASQFNSSRRRRTVGCGSRRPQLQWAMVGIAREVPVAAEHRPFMTDAKRGQESIDRSDLYPGTPAAIAQLRRPDVIVAIGYQQRYGGESIQDLFTGSRPPKALQKLLQDDPGGQDRLAAFDGPQERLHFHR